MPKRNKRRTGRDHIGNIPTISSLVTFEAGKGFVTAVIHIDGSTIGVKFQSPEHMLEFFTGLMEHAVIAWPNDPFIRYYLQDDD